ncbi:DUF4179 domain-containing protein [Bacillus sp. CGMCC 1.16607]|uniref:DUF4179 domain-containing protein n=1 Tax=Bacillus sp. CGMCC 1.16607 TaxID=3351842 RepID=UPI00363D97C7
MSIFNDLNDVKLDLSEFNDLPLSEYEQKRILKKVRNKIQPKKQKKKWLGVGAAVVATCTLSLALTIDKGTIANMLFVSEPIEKYINQIDTPDYASYKTAIGETKENSLGKFTLNEVMIDHKKILFSATFEPVEGVKFDYQTFIKPTVKVNGKEYTVTTGGEAIKLNESMYTIYSDVVLSEEINTKEVDIDISYGTIRYHLEDEQIIEQPWSFDETVTQVNLLAEKKVFELNKTITLNNGEIVTINKVVTTPISTAIYYDLSQSTSEDIYFHIQTEEDKPKEYPMEAFTSNERGDASIIRFNGLNIKGGKFFLVAQNSDHENLSSPIPIN